MNTDVLFTDLPIEESIQQAIVEMGFEKPSPIQAAAIPVILEGGDIIGQAKTGTGKTCAFGIPAVQVVEPDLKETQILIMCPTRELAMQVADEIFKLCKFKKGTRVQAVFGGASMEKQIDGLRRGAHIVVGTPGRILDHLDRGTLRLSNVKQVILDEADEMLDMGFRDDIESILTETPAERQTIFFSATMPKAFLDMTKRFQKNPQTVKISNNDMTIETIDQRYIPIRESDKLAVVGRLIDFYQPKLALIFCNTKRMVDDLVADMEAQNFGIEALHGDMRQMQRTQTMKKFKEGKVQILVATDVAARGIDVNDIEMVINYDLPMDTEYYVHRIGRTGRAGKKGISFALVTRRDMRGLRDIEHFAKTKIALDKVPTLKDIEKKKHEVFINKIKDTIDEGNNEKYLKWIAELDLNGYAPVDIAAALIKMEYHHIFDQYSKVDNIQSEEFLPSSRDGGGRDSGRGGRNDRGRDSGRGGRDSGRDSGRGPRESNSRGGDFDSRGSSDRGGDRGIDQGGERNSVRRDGKVRTNTGMTRLFMNIGKTDKVGPREIIMMLEEGGLKGKKVGEIDIYDKFAFVEVDMKETTQLLDNLNRQELRGRKLRVQEAKERT